MESYTRYYGRYAEQEWREKPPRWCYCPACGREALEFLIPVDEPNEVYGCTECTTTSIKQEERYMVDVEDEVYLQCPLCGEVCDTLYAAKNTPYHVDGCDNCMRWIDSYEVENDK